MSFRHSAAASRNRIKCPQTGQHDVNRESVHLHPEILFEALDPPGSPMPTPALLLVDDDRLALATMTEGLRAMGYGVAAADSPAGALERAAAQAFDLAILDIRMPGLSGMELAHLLERRHGLHSLFLSAYGERDEVVEAVRQGGLGYLVKPVDPARLMPAIETALARSRDLDGLALAKEQLEHALADGRHTSVAIGIVMAQRRLSESAAFASLRDEARRQRRKLGEHCRDLVAELQRSQHG